MLLGDEIMQKKIYVILGLMVMMVIFAGCGKPRPWYTITIKNNSGSQMDGVVLTCDAFSCEFENVQAGKVSEPTECRNPLPETAQLMIIQRGAPPITQNIPLKSKIGEKVDSATIEVVINPGNAINLNSTPRPLPDE